MVERARRGTARAPRPVACAVAPRSCWRRRRGGAHPRRRRARAGASRHRRPCARGSHQPHSRQSAGASPSASSVRLRGTDRRAAWRSRRRGPRPRSDRTTRLRAQDRESRASAGSAPSPPPAPAPARSRRSANGRGRRSSAPSANRSKPTNDAGISPASFSMRLAAGWIRNESRSKSRPCSVAITISPSITHCSGSCARIGATSSGKYRVSGFSLRLPISTSSPSRNTIARKPSHFGS